MSKTSEKSLEESLNLKRKDLLSEIKSQTVTVDQANPNLTELRVTIDPSKVKNQEAVSRRREGKGKRGRTNKRRSNKRRNSKRHSKRRVKI